MVKDFYTVKEFAKEYGVSTDRVYEWVRSSYIESLPRVTPHSIWRIPKTELERLKGKALEKTQSIIPKAKEEHLGKIRDLLKAWERNIRYHILNKNPCVLIAYEVEDDKLFPLLLQHCPLVHNCYQKLKPLRTDSIHLVGVRRNFSKRIMASLVLAEVNGEIGSWIWDTSSNAELLTHLTDYLLYGEQMDIAPKLRDLKRSSDRWSRDIFQYGPDTKSNEKWRKFVTNLIRFCPENRLRDEIRKGVTALYESELSLLDAVETSIASNEYIRNKCEWCPY